MVFAFICYGTGAALCAALFYGRLRGAPSAGRCVRLWLLLCVPAVFLGARLTALLAEGFASLRYAGAAGLISPDPEGYSFVGGAAMAAAAAATAAGISGIPVRRAMDAFALPGCLLVCFARLAEGGLGTVGLGDCLAGTPFDFFPLGLADARGDRYLAVFLLEALAALAAARAAAGPGRDGGFLRAAWTLSALQLFLEMLRATWIPFLISFVRFDQVLSALILALILLRRRASLPRMLLLTLLLAGNAFVQVLMDKPWIAEPFLPAALQAWTGRYLYPAGLLLLALLSFAVLWAGRKPLRGPRNAERSV